MVLILLLGFWDQSRNNSPPSHMLTSIRYYKYLKFFLLLFTLCCYFSFKFFWLVRNPFRKMKGRYVDICVNGGGKVFAVPLKAALNLLPLWLACSFQPLVGLRICLAF